MADNRSEIQTFEIRPVSHQEFDQYIARGHQLRSEAMADGYRYIVSRIGALFAGAGVLLQHRSARQGS